MQPYINPNYYNQYPMYQQQQNLQPTQMSLPNNGIRMYNNQNEIAVNEIPMDGTYKLFAKTDMSEVVAKAWGSNGLINTLEYSLKQPITEEKTENVPQFDLSLQFEPILAEIRALNDKIDKLGRTSNSKAKKEVVSDES